MINFQDLFLNHHFLVSAMVAAPHPPHYIPTEPLGTTCFQRQPDRSQGAVTGLCFV